MGAVRYPLAPVEKLLFGRFGRSMVFSVTVTRGSTVEQRTMKATDETGQWTLMALGRLLAPLPAHFGDSPKSIHHDVIRRWRETGLRESEADAIACRLGFHPLNIWPDYGQDPPERRATPAPQRSLFAGHKYERRRRPGCGPSCAASTAESSHQAEQLGLFGEGGSTHEC